uniref:Protein recA n=1 Tax=Siphoviridae sp. ctamP19 TaxID=2827896 RepID=A0A8S5TNA5_9CAUD|nr:MAG TPA: Protein recA [Siphoviridae sp. ctamP19]
MSKNNKISKEIPTQKTDINERAEALEKALKKIEKDYGKGAIMRLGEKTDIQIEVIPTGSILLDNALGVQGYPKGRIIEIFGPESSGKTTIALHAIAEAQKLGIQAAFIDAEHALDPIYAHKIGVNIDELFLSQPDTGEQGLEIADALVSSGAIGMVVIDSVAALVPKAEIDGEMGDSHVGLQARLMSQGLRKLSGTVNKTKCIVIFINQLREKVGVMFGNPETTPGGRALKFYSTIRLDVRRSEQIKDTKDKENPIKGNKTKIKVVKNKVASPFKTIELDLMYGEGISRTGEIISLSEDMGIIKKSGAWFDYNNGEIKVQGRELLREELKKNPKIMNKIEEKIRTVLSGGELPEEIESTNDEEYGQSRLDLSNVLSDENSLENSESVIDK